MLGFDLDQPCDIVTRNPDRRHGPMLLRFAVSSIVHHRPLADEVEVRLRDGQTLGEVEIDAIHMICVLPS